MTPTFSTFTQGFFSENGILDLMNDLADGIKQPGAIMLGGGNPSYIPAVQKLFRERMYRILDSESDFEHLVGDYGPPAGQREFIDALVDLFNEEYGWGVSAENIALTNGSQTAFFMLFNMFAGKFPDGSHKKILFPLAPEYIGYDVGLSEGMLTSIRPKIDLLDDNLFKYRVDFDALEVTDEIGAICVSRPTNPTGNVLTEEEINRLSDLALAHNIPLIIDNAYGTPFPSIIFTEATARWQPHIVMCMSLSKLGLPGSRTGIIVAHPDIIHALGSINAVVSLAPGTFGATMALDLVRTRDILRVSTEIIKPHYEQRARQAITWLREAFGDTPFRVHKPEGAFFLWLWFENLPITSAELYERLRQRNVLIVPGHHFFPGLEHDDWPHKSHCIRMNYAQPAEIVRKGIAIIADVIRHL